MRVLVEKSKRRDGIALLVVLGMLALLLVMAATFSVTMRTERLAAGNYASNVAGQQLVQAALADAIEEIDRVMVDGASTSSVYPLWTTLPSTGSERARLAWGEALEYIPKVYHDVAKTNYAGWITSSVGSGGVVGRRAFLVVNCSGLLDANFAGGADRCCSGTGLLLFQAERFPCTTG